MSRFYKASIVGVLLSVPQLILAGGWMLTFGGPQGDEAYWVEVTPDSGFIIVGNMLHSTGVYGYIRKTNSAGTLQWARTYPPQGIVQHSRLYCIQPTHDSGYVVVGEQVLWIEHGMNGSEFLWLLKLASNGDTVWTRTYGWDVHDERGVCIRETPDNGYIITGYTESRIEDPIQKDLWLLKTDSLGDTLWSLVLGDDTEFDWGQCVNLTSDGSYIVTGGNGKERSTWVLKINDSGRIEWAHTYHIEYLDSWGRYVEETPDGGYIITGAAEGLYESKLYVLKIDNRGDSLWLKSYGEGGKNGGRCIRVTSDGGYVVVGDKNHQGDFDPTGEAWLLKLDGAGDTVWTRTILYDQDGFNRFRCIQPVFDNGYIIAGETGDYEAETAYDMWLVRVDSLGYVGIAERIPHSSVPKVETRETVGSQVEFSYSGCVGGFHAEVFNSSGRKIDEIHRSESSGTVVWGRDRAPGVYFIRELDAGVTRKVVLVK